MKIRLYRYNGDPKRVYKTSLIDDGSGGVPPIEIDGDIREQSSVTDPVLTVETDANLSYYNYAHVDYFARYYFARFEIVRTGIWRVYLHSDVLSNAGYFFTVDPTRKVFLGRSEDVSLWSKRIFDGEYPIPAGYDVTVIASPSIAGTATFNEQWDTGEPFIITTAGTERGTIIP